MSFFKKIFNVFKNVIRDEVEEIKDLVITDQDREDADRLVSLVKAAANSYGVPIPDELKEVLSTALAYGVRDLKDGFKNPDNLIVVRIINELRETF